jgi:putative flippase GtrA
VGVPGTDRAEFAALLRTPLGRKLLRYSAVSVIALVLSETLLVTFAAAFGLSAVWSSTLATGLATIPAYFLNRQWVWSKPGRSHLWKEVVPFWVLAVIGWAFATVAVHIAESSAYRHHLHSSARVALIAGTYIAAYGVLWVGKFVLFNKVLFAHRTNRLPEALDGRSGIPG